MYSMTGYGQARVSCPAGIFRVEISSVNHRFCEISVRLPYELTILEGKIREYIGKRIRRGKLNVFFRWERKKLDKKVEIDNELLEKYLKTLRRTQRRLHLKGEVGIDLIANLPQVVRIEEPEIESDRIWQFVKRGVAQACDLLIAMRRKEGEVMQRQLVKSISLIWRKLGNIKRRSGKVADRYARLLHKRARELNLKVDEARFSSEVASIVQRMNIEEETTRFSGLLQQFGDTLGQKSEEIGRKLDFLIQELNREVNTIGAKANDLSISKNVIDIKTELQKVREQVQNVE